LSIKSITIAVDKDDQELAVWVATEEVDGMGDQEVAELLGLNPDIEVDLGWRNDAVTKRAAQLLQHWQELKEESIK